MSRVVKPMELPSPLPPMLVDFIAGRFKVLSEPMRIRLLDLLRQGELSVGELADEIGTSQQNVSKHLTTLHREGVLARRKQGNRVIYWIDDDSVLALCEHVCGSFERQVAELVRVVEQGERA